MENLEAEGLGDMDAYRYRDGILFAEEVSLETVAQDLQTPFYVYTESTLRDRLARYERVLADIAPLIAYAVKANSTQAVLRIVAAYGAGADTVSGPEIKRARAAGIPAHKIVFSGVGKTADDIRFALQSGIHQFNVESAPELDLIETLAREIQRPAAIGFRFNPHISVPTHEKISTGGAGHKFGLQRDSLLNLYHRAVESAFLKPCGLSIHIGSQILDIRPFEEAFRNLGDLAQEIQQRGWPLERLDLGGGIGVPYVADQTIDLAAYGRAASTLKKRFPTAEFIVEPGRFLVAEAGLLAGKVLYVKEDAKRFVVLDIGMNDLMRPSLYGAHHSLIPLRAWPQDGPRFISDIVGPVCETSDTFLFNFAHGLLKAGDWVGFQAAGAYGASMSSFYNSRPLIAEVLVYGDQWHVCRRSFGVECLMAAESCAPWQEL